MSEIEVKAGEAEPILDDPPEGQVYTARVTGNRVRLDHNQRRARQAGDLVETGDRVKLDEHRGMAVYAFNPGPGVARVEISEANLDIIFQPRATQNAGRSNRPGFEVVVHDPATEGNELPDVSIPDGFEATITARSGDLKVFPTGDSSAKATIKEDGSLDVGVSSLDVVSVEAATTGAVAEVTVEQ
jgi:hypothetical protein